MTSAAVPLVHGLLAAGYAVCALFFLKFWSRTCDRLFAMFAAAFALLAVHRVLAVLTYNWFGESVWLYVIRLVAFVLILVAIVDKNRAGTTV